MLKKKQALKNAEEDLNLEIEMVKTEAREKALAEMSEDESSDYNLRRSKNLVNCVILSAASNLMKHRAMQVNKQDSKST